MIHPITPLRSALAALFILGTSLAAHAAAPATAAELFIPTAENLALVKTEKAPVLSIDTSTGAPLLKVEFIGGSGYPGLDFPLTGGTINLSAFAGIQADITNLSTATLNINLRADNPGDWRKEPWNTNGAWIPAGKTQTVKLTFGQSHGGPAYALDASRISVIKLFAGNPKTNSAILVKNFRPFGTAGVREVSTATGATAPAAAAGKDATFSPSIGGELLDLEKNALAGFKYSESSAAVENGKVKVTFAAGSNYPNIQFPIPKGGWNLDAFGNIEVTVTNPNDKKVTAYLRADNPGDWKAEPWNTEKLTIDAGETKTLTLTFGQQNGAPAFPLNSKRISAIQLFIVKPKTDTTLLLSDLKGSGSPSAVAGGGLTSPADRDVPVTPPAWLGQRPPVEGDWVQTLNENFDGTTLNDKLWTPRFPWDGPQPGQLQRYAPQNVIVADGVVSFKSEKLLGHENNDPARPTREYTSGLIQSYDKFAQLYGYFEARVKLPTARGLWPAFWMMPDRGAASGLNQWQRRDTGKGAMEIDILEHLAEWGPGRNNVALHWDGYGDKHQAWGTSHVYFGPTPDGWHNFGLLWEPGKLTWFIDGKKVVEYANERVSTVPSYIKLNTQMGGWATKDVDLSKLPDYFKVDHVRVWQLKERLK
jgi:beta-glucanase (GH16 family)